MLSLLKIQNLALVEDLAWELEAGLIGVTGETGAGKSIIVGALQLILGARADRGLIRTGAETCTVEAVFDLKKSGAVDAILTETGLDALGGESLIIRRVVGASTSKQFVNGSPVTSAMLKQLGEHLVDLHGPHDHQSLNSKERQLEMLDAYAGVEALAEKYRTSYHVWRRAQSEHDELSITDRATEQEMDMLRFQIKDIADADLKDGEAEEIESRHSIAANGTRLVELCGQISDRLGDGENSVLHGLRDVAKAIYELEKIDPKLADTFVGFESAHIELREIENSVRDYAEGTEIQPEELARLEQRIHTIETLKRKYGPTVKDILAFKEQAEAKLAKMENRGDELEKLRLQAEAARGEVNKTGLQLTIKRKAAAPKLSKDISTHLADLGFHRAVFEVPLVKREDPARDGLEEVDFHFAPNPGEPLKPLRLTASSGEMSRVLLAVKSALAKQDAIPLMVFDEIDANVGGAISEAVGRKMAALAERHQVIAITHMPQLAGLAKTQFVVTKEFDAKRTRSTITEVKGKGRVAELARMLGGKAESAKAHAESLLAAARCMIVCTLMICAPASCAHQQKDGGTGPRLAERLSKWDMTKHSSFEKELSATKSNKVFKAGAFRTSEYKGAKDFAGASSAYRTKDFQQASKTSNAADKSFRDAKKDSGLASSEFKTKQSSMDQKTSRDAGKNFTDSDKTYQTKDERDATKALKKKSHPVMVDTGKPTYTEDEVRGLLNKK